MGAGVKQTPAHPDSKQPNPRQPSAPVSTPPFQPPAPACCVVCDDELDGPHRSACQMCGGAFHYPWLPQSDAPRCGRAASHQDTLAVIFLCQDCYRKRHPASASSRPQ